MQLTEKELKVLEFRKKEMTQVEIARSLKISQAAVSSFENNEFLDFQTDNKFYFIRDYNPLSLINSEVENIFIASCVFSNLSLDQIGQFNLRAKAKYSTSSGSGHMD